ncbi:MAG: TIGR02147 family protein [Bacteriovoracaceae bacterium]
MEEINLFKYHDYREFLSDYIKKDKTSLRKLSRDLELSPSYLSMIISGSRNINDNHINHLAQKLNFSEQERTYFQNLVELSDSKDIQKRKIAYKKMGRFKKYQERNPKEIETYQYLEKWYYVAIREMTFLKDFKADPKWIQRKLQKKVSIQAIKKSLKFLEEKGFIQIKNKKILSSNKQLNCIGGIYKLSLSSFHNQMLSLAHESIYSVESQKRNILGHTLALSESQFEQVKEIMNEALEKIKDINNQKETNEQIYHISLLSFPLTKEEA